MGEKVFSVNILNMNNDTVALPMLGQKNLLIFYADPSHPGQNKTFRDYFKTHPVSDRKSTRLNSSHASKSRMPSSA